METTTLYNEIESLIDNNQYNEACNTLAENLGLKLKVVSHRFDSMQWDKDGQKRNIFKLKLIRGKNNYTFEFGSSLNDSVKNSNAWEQMKDNDLISVYSGVANQSQKVYGSVTFEVTKKEIENLNDAQLLVYATMLKDGLNISVSEYNKKQRSNWEHIKNFGSVESAVPYITKAVQRKIGELKNTSCVSNEPLTEIKTPDLYDVLACLQKYEVGTFEDFCDNFGYDSDSRTAEKTYKAVLKEWKAMERLFNNEELELLQLIN